MHSDIIPIIISFSITSLNSQMLDAGGCLDGMCSTPGDVVQKPLKLRWIRRAEAEQVMETSPRMYQELVLAQAVGQGRVRTAEMMAWTGRKALMPGFCNGSPPGYHSPQRVCG